MFSWNKKEKGDKTLLELDSTINRLDDEAAERDIPTEIEQETVAKVENDFWSAKTTRESEVDDTGFSVEENWEDEYYIYKGGGLQWLTNFAYRTRRNRKIRPNSEDNFVFNAITIQHANVTAETPEICVYGSEHDKQDGDDDDAIGEKLTDVIKHIHNKNKFSEVWKKWGYDFLGAGPTIAMVTWDNDWIGGAGPERWIGETRLTRCDKWDMFFDPAVKDLETDLQDCEYIVRRVRKRLDYIRKNWDKGRLVPFDMNEDEMFNEGSSTNQAYVYEYWYRGFPWFVSDEQKQELREKAMMLEEDGDTFKSQDYYDAAKGILEGVHVCYVAGGVLLEHRAYEYEHGQYPFVFTTNYFDEKSPWGFGQIRNIKIPQIMHNKADEIEIEAMTREGLGGAYYQAGALTPTQLEKIKTYSSKGGMWFEVDQLPMIKDRTGAKVPASITNYKEHKQKMVETVSSNTPIQQGLQPSSNIPFASIKELGSRSDVVMKRVSEKLEDFLKRIVKMEIDIISQFYTEERYYRVRGGDNKVNEGTIQNTEIQQKWTRETVTEEITNPLTNEPIQVTRDLMETFIPDFDVKVTVLSEKPQSREYYTELATWLFERELLVPEDLLSTFEDGKLPPMQDILDNVYKRQPIMGILKQIQDLPPDVAQMVNQQLVEVAQQLVGQMAMQDNQQRQMNKQGVM